LFLKEPLEMRELFRRLPYGAILSFFLIAALRLFISARQPLQVIEGSQYDDALYFQQAVTFSRFFWLGHYTSLTLAKGPFFSIYAGVMHWLHIPIIFSYHLLWVTAGGFLCLALHPLVRNPWWSAALFASILFIPYSLAGELNSRFLRDSIYPALSLFLAAGAIGYFLRAAPLSSALGRFGVIFGLAFAAVWLTREEGLWVVPMVAILYGVAVFRLSQDRSLVWKRRLLLGMAPVLGAAGLLLLVAACNRFAYYQFILVETQSRPFSDAYGALLRIKHENWRRFVPVPKDAREKAYEISPTYARLKPFQEGNVGAADRATSCREVNICDDIAGGWFIWSFRDSATAAGIFRNGKISRDFFRDMAQEINTACDSGKIDCFAKRSGLMVPWRAEYFALTWQSIKSVLKATLAYKDFSLGVTSSSGSKDYMEQVAGFTRSPYSTGSNSSSDRFARIKGKLYELTTILYTWLTLPLGLLGLLPLFAALLQPQKSRDDWSLILVQIALLVGVVTRISLFALVDATSYPAANMRYLTALHPLYFAFSVIGCGVMISRLQLAFSRRRLRAI